MRRSVVFIILCFVLLPGSLSAREKYRPLRDDGSWYYLPADALTLGKYHTRHAEVFGKDVAGTYNEAVLEGIDAVQATTYQGGGYFIGIKARPTESPVGYPLKLFGLSLIDPPRTTSYCSGSSYAAFIESLNRILPDGASHVSLDRFEACRMQEPDGGRREDQVKFWGHWNDDGYGSHYALVQYSKMGQEVLPKSARPGDFMNISWTHGGGHSVVFLGWLEGEKGPKGIAYWSSQTSTNGFGDVINDSTGRISKVKIVRLTQPEKLFEFDIAQPVNRKIPGDKIE